MANKTFKIIFTDKSNKIIEIDYKLHDTLLAIQWFSKIKHLHKIDIDVVESQLEDVSNLDLIYKEFCDFAGLIKMPLRNLSQITYNALHKIFEDNQDRLSGRRNNGIVYKFHHAIHNAERGYGKSRSKLNVGWGVKEGPLTQYMNCQPFYEDSIKRNNLYLPWAELGKTPYAYWRDREPNNQERFNQLAKPHTTFRAKFFIATEDKVPSPLNTEFVEWFEMYKEEWFAYHGITKWNKILEESAPLLATTDYKGNMKDFKFHRIIL